MRTDFVMKWHIIVNIYMKDVLPFVLPRILCDDELVPKNALDLTYELICATA